MSSQINIYVIAEPCIGVKDGSCVDVCPVACIHTTPEADQFYIDPDICIACEQCEVVCPVNAIFLDQDLPPQWAHFTQINADFFQEKKPAPHAVSYETACQMLDAIRSYAAGAGLSVAAAVLDNAGQPIVTLDGADRAVAEQALNKAFTSWTLQVPTDELRGKPAPASIDAARYVPLGGAIPIVDGPWVLGAVGVAGSPSPVQDVQCCRAGLAILSSVNH